MQSTAIIYKATSKTTGKSYIGQTTKSLRERKSEHIREAFSGSYDSRTKFYKAIRTFTPWDFVWGVILEIDSSTLTEEQLISILNDKEREFVKLYNSFRDGYNSNRGGGNHVKGFKYASKEEKAKARQMRRKAKRAKRTKEEMSSWCKDRRKYNNSPEQKARKSERRRQKRAQMTKEEKTVYREKKNLQKRKRIEANPLKWKSQVKRYNERARLKRLELENSQ